MKNKTIIRATDGSTLILHCFECHHEKEVAEFDVGTKCDWCGNDMGVIGVGTKWYDIKQSEPEHWVKREELLNEFIHGFLCCLEVIKVDKKWVVSVRYDDTKDRLRDIYFRHFGMMT